MRDAVRIDRWLWAVRIFKTRSDAASACRLSQVKINGHVAKPARTVSLGDSVQVEREQISRELKVTGLLEKRVGAKLVGEYLEDLTPQEEIDRASAAREQLRLNRVYLVRGEGRPSKKQRREMDKFLDEVEQSADLMREETEKKIQDGDDS